VVCVGQFLQGSHVSHVSGAPAQINGMDSDGEQVMPSLVSPNTVLHRMVHVYDAVRSKYLVNNITLGYNMDCARFPVQTYNEVVTMKPYFKHCSRRGPQSLQFNGAFARMRGLLTIYTLGELCRLYRWNSSIAKKMRFFALVSTMF